MPNPADAPAPRPAPERLLSLDALRGFDMFWIAGAGIDQIVRGLATSENRAAAFVVRQLRHTAWEGFTFLDLIFPLFLFIVGISIVYSLGKVVDGASRRAALIKIIKRSALLYLLGILYYRGIADGWENVRLVGVLQRIAICYLVAAILFCTLRLRGLIVTCAALLLGYWALVALVPIREISVEKRQLARHAAETGISDPHELYARTSTRVTGRYDEGMNLADHIDFRYLPLRKNNGHYDNEGLLSTLPCIALCLFGIFAGQFLRSARFDGRHKVRWLLGAGVAAVAVGWTWGYGFPVIKRIWTSSYILVAAGYSCLMLAAFYQVIEVWGRRRWATPFVWIGMNPIAVYMASNIVSFNALAERLVGGRARPGQGVWGYVLQGVVSLTLMILLVRFLHRRKIFLRL